MSDAQTYDELKAEVLQWLIRDDLEAMAPQFIAKAERRFNRVLRVPEMEQVSTTEISTSPITLPTDFLELKAVHLDTSPLTVLTQMGVDVLQRTYPYDRPEKPRHFALQSGGQMVFGPVPDTTYDVIINYFAKIPALSSDNADNWLLLAHPDLYLAAALVEGFAYARDADAMAFWLGQTQQKIGELEEMGRRKAASQAPQRLTNDAAPWAGCDTYSFAAFQNG